jgi:hypothetical protein
MILFCDLLMTEYRTNSTSAKADIPITICFIDNIIRKAAHPQENTPGY